MMTFLEMEHLFAEDAMLLFFLPRANLMPVAGGQPLMKIFQTQ
jgi:hypothetical protein